ncbi:MAG: UxaA family hydrolase [Nitrososphaerota archaeon]
MRGRHKGQGRKANTQTSLNVIRSQRLILLHPRDNVGVAVQDINRGEALLVGRHLVEAKNTINQGHKIAIKNIPKGGGIIKLGIKIGVAKKRIRAGEHVHIHNVESLYEWSG